MLRSHVQEGWARPKQQWGWGGRKLNLGAPHGWPTKHTLPCLNREWESRQSRVSKPHSDQGVGLPPGLSAARPEPTPCSHCEITFSKMNRCVWEQHEKVHTLVNHIQRD